MSEARILITGAEGFVGRALRTYWRERGVPFIGAVRAFSSQAQSKEVLVAMGDAEGEHWRSLLGGIDVVVHLAGRAHVMRERAAAAEARYVRGNVEVTQGLAQVSYRSGVRRIVFASSVKVNGESTGADRPFTEDDAPAPTDAYGRTKWAAEHTLMGTALDAQREAVLLRLPLVYGPGVKGNFLALLNWIGRGRPLPFGAIENRRSLLYIGNLVSAIHSATMRPEAANRTYLVCDNEAPSTPELCQRIAASLGVRARLLSVPPALLRGIGAVFAQGAAMEKLVGSLVIDNARIRRELVWSPPATLDLGLAATAEWWRSERS